MALISLGIIGVFIGGYLLGYEQGTSKDISGKLKVAMWTLVVLGAAGIFFGTDIEYERGKEKGINEYLNGEIEVEIEETKTYKIKYL